MAALEIRFLILYPLNVVLGVAWALLFIYRQQKRGPLAQKDASLWAALLGLAVVVQAFGGLVGLWLRDSSVEAYGEIASWLFSLGIGSITIILASGVLCAVLREWRNGGRKKHD